MCLAGGSILIIGGGNDRNSWAEEPFIWFIQQADSGIIINIDVDEVATSYASTFINYGADPASHSLRIENRTTADDSATYFQLINARGIFIEGGDQWDYVSTWKNTLTEDAIHYVYNQGGVIAGTSAGCAIMGEVCFDAKYGSLYPEDAAVNPYHQRMHFEDDFLDVLPNVLTDSHFHQRGRLGRLIPMLARRIQDYGDVNLLGIGVDENTALCVNPDLTSRVVGEGLVTIFHQTELSNISCEAGEAVTFTHIRYHQLNHGAIFDLNVRELLEAGENMERITEHSQISAFPSVFLDGSLEETGSRGIFKISSYTRNNLDAWYGRLSLTPGDSIVPNSIIVPRLWSDNNYFENRIIGGMFAGAKLPGLICLFLDDGSALEILENDVFSVKKMAYLLDTQAISHAGILNTRNTNLPGLVGGTIHFLGDGIKYKWSNGFVPVSENIDNKVIPDSHKLLYNYPNPFNQSTTIEFALLEDAKVNLSIYNTNGQKIAILLDHSMSVGYHRTSWYGLDMCANPVSTGLYVLLLTILPDKGSISQMQQKMIYLK